MLMKDIEAPAGAHGREAGKRKRSPCSKETMKAETTKQNGAPGARAKLAKQIAVLAAAALIFALFDLCIYQVFTRRVVKTQSAGMLARSVELADFLPFEGMGSEGAGEAGGEGTGGREYGYAFTIPSDIGLTGDPSELPVLDGAAALYPVFSGIAGSLYPEGSCPFDGSYFLPDSRLQMRNTRAAYKAIVDGDADIVFCAPPSDEQLAYAREQGVELDLIPIGREAFVFVVNSNNPVESLTQQQVRDIYSGKIRNWKELGGEDRHISVLQRNPGSGSQTAMLAFMGGVPIKDDRFSFLGSSIGFSFRYYVSALSGTSGVKMIALDGVYPSPENVRSGAYPVVSEFFAVRRAGEDDPNVDRIIEWILGPDGQELIERSGYAGV